MPDLCWPSDRTEITAGPDLFNCGQLKLMEHKFLRYHLVSVLVEIFSNLQRCDNQPNILGTSQKFEFLYPENFTIRGLERLRRIPRGGWLWQSDDGLYTVLLYMALVKRGYATRKLELGSTPSDIPLSLFSYLPQRFPTENLRVLCLGNTLSDDNYGDPLQGCLVRKQHVADLITIIAKAQNLQELRLRQSLVPMNVPVYRAYDLLRDVFLALAARLHLDGTSFNIPCGSPITPTLEILHLDNHVVPRELLLTFCSERKETLKKVRLENVRCYGMFDNDSMKDFMVEIMGGDHDSVIMESCDEIWQ